MGRKINLSGISLAKRSLSRQNLAYVDMSRGDNVQGILDAIGPFWPKWGLPFWPKWGLGRVPHSPSYFCLVSLNHAPFRQLRNGRFSPSLVTKRSSVSRRGIQKDIFENFHFRGHLPPKSEIEIRSNRHLTQGRLQVTGCTAERYCLLRIVVQGGHGVSEVGQLFCMTYGCGATGHQICPIFGFWPYFPHTKPQNVPSAW